MINFSWPFFLINSISCFKAFNLFWGGASTIPAWIFSLFGVSTINLYFPELGSKILYFESFPTVYDAINLLVLTSWILILASISSGIILFLKVPAIIIFCIGNTFTLTSYTSILPPSEDLLEENIAFSLLLSTIYNISSSVLFIL